MCKLHTYPHTYNIITRRSCVQFTSGGVLSSGATSMPRVMFMTDLKWFRLVQAMVLEKIEK